MKKKTIIQFIATLQLVSLLFCSSCGINDFFEVLGNAYGPGGGRIHWDIIPEGLSSNVTGRCYDNNRNLPITNLTVYIAEYIDDPVLGLTFSRYIDSTRTDQNGNFDISFVTTGEGVQYQLSIKWPDVNWLTYSGYPFVIKDIGTKNIINVELAELSILEAKIKIVENTRPPFRAGTDYFSFYELYGANKDTTIFFRVMPNRKTRIFFFISVDTVSDYYYREQLDTINIEGDFSDTVRAEFELHPNQFKRRN